MKKNYTLLELTCCVLGEKKGVISYTRYFLQVKLYFSSEIVDSEVNKISVELQTRCLDDF